MSRWMQQHLEDNGIDRGRCRLIEAAGEHARAPAGSASDDRRSGMDNRSRAISTSARRSSGNVPSKRPTGRRCGGRASSDFDEVLAGVDRVDYMHLDIQGSELEVLAAWPELLQTRVQMVTIGTHSELIERGLRRLFASLGWTALYDVPLRRTALVRIGDKKPVEIRVGDGDQVWLTQPFR